MMLSRHHPLIPCQFQPSGQHKPRKGAVVPLTVSLMAVMVACIALALDVGYLSLVRAQLQNSADSAALAGAATLYRVPDALELSSFYLEPDVGAARLEAQLFARYNGAGQYHGTGLASADSLRLEPNHTNESHGDIVTGILHDPSMLSLPLIPTAVNPNTVQITARFADGHANGSLGMFFARALGMPQVELNATAAATVIYPSLVPFGTSLDKWNTLQTGGDSDSYGYDRGVVFSGDGIPEITIFPDVKWDGQELPPGNFGALSIGTDTASAADLRRQIDQGPTPAEFQFHGALTPGVEISGKTGMNATVKTAFNGGWDTSDLRYYQGILGHPRYLPICSDAEGNGTNAMFEIVKFVGVRVMAVDLQGKQKSITLQPINQRKHLLSVRLTR